LRLEYHMPYELQLLQVICLCSSLNIHVWLMVGLISLAKMMPVRFEKLALFGVTKLVLWFLFISQGFDAGKGVFEGFVHFSS
jgi:hypothetical protein